MAENQTNLTATEFIYSHDPSDAMRYILVFWSLLNFLLSLSGNTLVLVSSIKYHAINLDEVSVILIRYLAVADMMNCVPKSLTAVPGLVLKRWVLGSLMCAHSTVNGYITAIVSNVHVSDICLERQQDHVFEVPSEVETEDEARRPCYSSLCLAICCHFDSSLWSPNKVDVHL